MSACILCNLCSIPFALVFFMWLSRGRQVQSHSVEDPSKFVDVALVTKKSRSHREESSTDGVLFNPIQALAALILSDSLAAAFNGCNLLSRLNFGRVKQSPLAGQIGCAEIGLRTRSATLALQDHEARGLLARQSLNFSHEVMLKLQSPGFLDSSGFEKLHNMQFLAQPAASDIKGAGVGLKATRDLDAGSVVSLYPAHGIGMYNLYKSGKVAIAGEADDLMYWDSLGKRASYRHVLPIGMYQWPPEAPRGLFFLSAPDMKTGAYHVFIDCNPNRDRIPGWHASLINDAAKCEGSSEEQVHEYYEKSVVGENCVIVPFGPSPLMAAVTTRTVKAGEELLTYYQHKYWVEAETPMTPRILELQRMELTQRSEAYALAMKSYATDIALMERIFSTLIESHLRAHPQLASLMSARSFHGSLLGRLIGWDWSARISMLLNKLSNEQS